MKNKITAAAKSAGIEAVGVCRARVYEELLPFLSTEQTPMTADINERINPFLLMSEARSVIVCLFPYFVNGKRSNLSIYAKGKDYHTYVKKRMAAIEKVLCENGFSAMSFSDSAPLVDRYLAYLSGLGFFGKNRALISPVYGSYTFIGYILTDAEIEEDMPMERRCADCGMCIKACPGGALCEKGFDAAFCASYITQKKGELSKKEEEIIQKSGYAWGCDICQSVCPHNKNIPDTSFDEFLSDTIAELTKGMAESNREFKRKFCDRAFSWRGLEVIERNLEILKEK